MQRKNLLASLIVPGLGIIGTLQYHRAQFSSRFDIFFGDRGDARGFAYFCEHWYQAFLGKTNLLSPGIFYPAKGALAYSDLLLGYAIPYSLLRALGVGMFSSVEIVVIVLAFLSYLVCFILLKRVLGLSLLPSCAGAMFFAFSSPKFFQTGHIQLQFILFLPLIFICVICFVQKAESLDQKRAARWLSLAGVFFNLQLLTAFYYAWFFAFWSFLFLALALIFRSSRLFIFALIKKYWPAMCAGAAIFLLGFIPFLLIYLPTVRVGTWYSYTNVSLMIPEWWSLLSMGDGNYVWGRLAAFVRPQPWPATWGELMIGIGLVPSLTWLALTVYALWLLKKYAHPIATKHKQGLEVNRQNVARMFLAVMILATTLFYLLGLKYWGGHSPWYFVYHSFPGTGAIRAMARYVIFLTLPMAIGFAFILDSRLKSAANQKGLGVRRGLFLAIALVAGFGVFEQFGSFKVGGTGFSVRAEEAYLNAMAGKLPHDCKAFYITPGPKGKHNPFEYQYDAMLISILTGVPTLNASSSQFPPDWSLYLVNEPDYENKVEKWIGLHHIEGKVCRLEIGPQVEAFSYHAPNPIGNPVFFVSQQYRDFLNREPRSEEIHGWVERLKGCKTDDPSCSPPQIALDLFHSTQFYERGSFIFRLYEVGLARMPRYEEFLKEMQRLDTYQDSGTGESAREKFVDEFTKTAEFASRHNGLSEGEYREKLLETVQVHPTKNLTSGIGKGNTRARILLDIVENDEVSRKLLNRAFVALHYFAFLRRDPEQSGFEQWLATLNSNNDFRHVTSGFVNSSEYRERFGY